jgi:predicted AAA+ superfamily ATPase
VPTLVTGVHRAMAASDRRFVLLGSNVRPLWTAAGLLNKRVAVQTMYPLVPAELGRDFALDRVLRFGSLPAVWDAADPWAALEAYLQAYVRDEIRGEAVVRNLSAFLRFLPAAARAHGQVVNIAALARDAATSRMTVDGYLRILRDTLMATLLPAFEPRLRVRERRHPKLYWTDSGVVRAAKRQLGNVAVEERGPLLEGLVLTVLRAHNGRTEVFDDIGYWAPAQARATEVDFLLRRGRDYLAIEVRAQTRNALRELAGLRAIANLPRLVRRVLVYLGDRLLRTEDGIHIWPLSNWLDAVAAGRLWP